MNVKVMKKLIQVALFVILSLTLSGCSLAGLDPQDLISPPNANQDQQAIQQLLKKPDEVLNFVYPKRGEYRSAVIMHDFNGDGIEDAVGFTSKPEGGVLVQFMFETDEGWETVSTYENTGIQVDKVLFGNLWGENQEEMIVGWGSPQSLTATISVYRYIDGRVVEYNLEQQYDEFMVTSFGEEGRNELFISTVYTQSEEEGVEGMPSLGMLYTFDSGTPTLYKSVNLNDKVVRYNSCSFSKINNNISAIILEGALAEGSSVTQIVTMDNNLFAAPLSWESNQQHFNFFFRPSALNVQAQDINEDGIIEFPMLVLQDGYAVDSVKVPVNYYVDWVQFRNNSWSTRVIERTVMNSEMNFMFSVDEEYNILCEEDENGGFTVSEAFFNRDGEFSYRHKLFNLQVLTQEEWDEVEGYERLFIGGNDMVYAVKAYSSGDLSEEIQNSIKPIFE